MSFTPEQIDAIQQLIDSSIGTVKDELNTAFTNANKGLAASLTKELKNLKDSLGQPKEEEKQPTPTSTPEGEQKGDKLSLKALQTEIEKLRGEIADKDQKVIAANRSTALTSAIAKHKALSPNVVHKHLLQELGDRIAEENGSWFVSDGDKVTSLDDAVGNFLKSDDGKVFLAPSGIKGAGSTETKKLPVGADKPKAIDAIYDALG